MVTKHIFYINIALILFCFQNLIGVENELELTQNMRIELQKHIKTYKPQEKYIIAIQSDNNPTLATLIHEITKQLGIPGIDHIKIVQENYIKNTMLSLIGPHPHASLHIFKRGNEYTMYIGEYIISHLNHVELDAFICKKLLLQKLQSTQKKPLFNFKHLFYESILFTSLLYAENKFDLKLTTNQSGLLYASIHAAFELVALIKWDKKIEDEAQRQISNFVDPNDLANAEEKIASLLS